MSIGISTKTRNPPIPSKPAKLPLVQPLCRNLLVERRSLEARRQDRATGKHKISAGRIIVAACILALLLWLSVFDIVVVRGPSMEPGLPSDSLALLLRCAYGLRLPGSNRYLIRWSLPAVNDIVVVDKPNGSSSVKRIFETGPAYLGSRAGWLEGRGGRVLLSEDSPLRAMRQIYVAAERVFLLGDNLDVSQDSRHYGSVSVDLVRGRVIVPASRLRQVRM